VLSFVLKILPTILSLINRLLAYARDRRMLKAGRSEAIAEQLDRLSATVSQARATEAAAEAAHATNQTDDAFDREFERKD